MEGYFVPFYNGDVQHWKHFFDEYFCETLKDYLSKRSQGKYIGIDKYVKLRQAFIASDHVGEIIERLSRIEIAGNQLRKLLIYFVHPYTFFSVAYFVEKEIGYDDIASIKNLREQSDKLLDDILIDGLFEKVILYCSMENSILRKLSDIWNNFYYEGLEDSSIPRISSVHKIVDCIEKRYRADYFSASYTTRRDNFSMWSHYAGVQNGVCLGFKVHHDESGMYALFDVPKEKVYFTKIKYGDSLLCNIPEFNSLRLMDLPGCELDVKKYIFEKQKVLYSYKLDDWKYESEYRLLLLEGLKGMQKLKYSMTELKEVIFGCNVDTSDKIKIINIIKDNCNKFSLAPVDIKFYEISFGDTKPNIRLIYEVS